MSTSVSRSRMASRPVSLAHLMKRPRHCSSMVGPTRVSFGCRKCSRRCTGRNERHRPPGAPWRAVGRFHTWAGPERGVDSTIRKGVRPEHGASTPENKDLRVSRRVGGGQLLVASPRDDSPSRTKTAPTGHSPRSNAACASAKASSISSSWFTSRLEAAIELGGQFFRSSRRRDRMREVLSEPMDTP